MSNARSRALVLAGSAIWCLAILSAPMLHFHGIYDFFSRVCHQNPLRSWTLSGEPLPVCIRCSCIYFGFFLGVLFSFTPSPKLLRISVTSTVLEFVLARTLVDSAWLRGATGLLLGAAAAPFVVVGIQEMLQMRLRRGAV
jgi:uncharacterized membrane protein